MKIEYDEQNNSIHVTDKNGVEETIFCKPGVYNNLRTRENIKMAKDVVDKILEKLNEADQDI